MKKNQAAEDFRDLRELSHSFKDWREHAVMKTIERRQKYNQAICHYNRYGTRLSIHPILQTVT